MPAKSTTGRTTAPVPKSGRDCRHGRRCVRKDVTCKKRHCRQSKARPLVEHEAALCSEHLLCGKRQLFDWPPIFVQIPDRARTRRQVGGYHTRLIVAWIDDHDDPIGLAAGLLVGSNKMLIKMSFE